MFQHNSNQVMEEDAKQKLRQSEVQCTALDIAYYIQNISPFLIG